jgi:hypothetical protein
LLFKAGRCHGPHHDDHYDHHHDDHYDHHYDDHSGHYDDLAS